MSHVFIGIDWVGANIHQREGITMLFGGLPQFVECVFLVDNYTGFLTECDNWVQSTIDELVEADCGNEDLAKKLFNFWNSPRNQLWLESFYQENRQMFSAHLGKHLHRFEKLNYDVSATHSVLAEIN
jgi:hypothetical protein